MEHWHSDRVHNYCLPHGASQIIMSTCLYITDAWLLRTPSPCFFFQKRKKVLIYSELFTYPCLKLEKTSSIPYSYRTQSENLTEVEYIIIWKQ